MNTTLNGTASNQFVWPLPATQLSNAHLTWSAYQSWQVTHLSDVPASAPTPDMPAGVVRYLPTSAAQPFAWPLPATQLPHAHLTWTEWTDELSARLHGQQPERIQSDRAA